MADLLTAEQFDVAAYEAAQQQPEQAETDITNPQPIGKNRFGNVYQWVAGKAKEAAQFLRKHKNSYLKGVFHREEIGDIDLVWGDDKAGLQHIIRRHIEEQDDFDGINEAIEAIEQTIKNGEIRNNGKGRITIDNGKYSVILAQDDNGNWIITAYDSSRPREEKQRNALSNTPQVLPSKGQNTLSDVGLSHQSDTQSVSTDKGTANNSDVQAAEPNIDTMEAEMLAASTVEYLGGDKATAKAYLEAERDKAKADAKRLSGQKVKKYADIADFKQQNDELNAQKQAAAERLDKLEAAVIAVNNYKTQAEQQAEAERKAQEAAAMAGQVPDVSIDKAADARKRGYRMESGHVIERQMPTQGLTGNAVEVMFSTKDRPHGQVKVIEASLLQPSHIDGQRNNRFFITEAQPKERTDKASQIAAMEIARNIVPQQIIEGTTAYQGAPVVNRRGEVIQGNNRSNALKYMYDNVPEQAAIYKQYLIDNAERFGLDAEQIAAMQQPVLTTELDVSDEEAIRLGQKNAQDTESGGTQRIDSAKTAQMLGDKLPDFVQRLMLSDNEEASLSDVVEQNGGTALKYLLQKNIINQTQYQSAFDQKTGKLTPEAKTDLTDIVRNMLFAGANDNIKVMFGSLPQAAQKAILQTVARDAFDADGAKVTPYVQEAIEIFYLVRNDEIFAAAKTMDDYMHAIDSWSRQSQMDFAGNTFFPVQKYSNFAMALAATFKSQTMATQRAKFNALYDKLQGVGGDMFDQAEKLTLSEAVEKVYNVQLNRRKQHAANDGSNVLADGSGNGGQGQRGGTSRTRSERPTARRERTTDNSATTATDNRTSPTDEAVTAAATPQAEPSAPYGSSNKVVTTERYEELRRRMQSKLRGQMNMGLDPELVALGLEMAAYHIEAGARKFIDFAQKMIDDMGDVIRPYLKAFYNGARDLPEMADYVSEMDEYAAVSAFDVNSVSLNEQKKNADNVLPNEKKDVSFQPVKVDIGGLFDALNTHGEAKLSDHTERENATSNGEQQPTANRGDNAVGRNTGNGVHSVRRTMGQGRTSKASHLQNVAAWLSAQPNGDLLSSTRNREGRVSELLIGYAKDNGFYIDPKTFSRFGEKYHGHTGESIVYIDKRNGRVVKIKDPFAKGAMKGDTPENILDEVLAHNELFPNTPYTLLGISEHLGDVRLVLEQPFVDTAWDEATEADIAAYLQERGFNKSDKYSYTDGKVTVTDVTGENVLKDADGNLYFIDPIIRIDTTDSKQPTDGETERTQDTVGEITAEKDTRYEDYEFSIVSDSEAAEIRRRAEADGTFMRAPNGKPTRLTERQWLQVRTRAFKEWFGDWEKAARIEKLKHSEPIKITGREYEGKYELNRESAKAYIKENLRGKYQNEDTGDTILLAKDGAQKVTSHSMGNDAHLKSIAAIPELIEKSIFIDELPNEKNNDKYESYRYYVSGLNIGGVDYTVKLAIGVDEFGNKYYDHSLTQIEKGKLIDEVGALSTTLPSNGQSTLSEYKDTKLISILQTNSSKVVDENGEPLVVYHGSKSIFSVFDTNGQQGTKTENTGAFFTDNRRVAVGYSSSIDDISEEDFAQLDEYGEHYGGGIYPTFLNIRNPLSVECNGNSWDDVYGERWRVYNEYGDVVFASGSEYECQEYCEKHGDESLSVEPNEWGTTSTDEIIRYDVKNSEYDGAVFENIVDNADSYEISSNVYIVLNPSQIKSATDNVGTFDGTNDDIRFDRRNTETKADTAARREATEAVLQLLRDAGVKVELVDESALWDMADAALEAKRKRSAPETALPADESAFKGTVVSSTDGAKVLKNIDTLAKDYENLAIGSKSFLGDLAQALGAERKGSSSRYATFETKNGQIVTIRLANHNASTVRMDNAGNDNAISNWFRLYRLTAGLVEYGHIDYCFWTFEGIYYSRKPNSPWWIESHAIERLMEQDNPLTYMKDAVRQKVKSFIYKPSTHQELLLGWMTIKTILADKGDYLINYWNERALSAYIEMKDNYIYQTDEFHWGNVMCGYSYKYAVLPACDESNWNKPENLDSPLLPRQFVSNYYERNKIIDDWKEIYAIDIQIKNILDDFLAGKDSYE